MIPPQESLAESQSGPISVRPATTKERFMKPEYDFSKGRRGQAVPTKGKTRITIYFDDQIVAAFKAESARTGIGYQTLINEGLARYLGTAEKPITAKKGGRLFETRWPHG